MALGVFFYVDACSRQRACPEQKRPPTYCILQNLEYNSLIWNEPFSIEPMKGIPP